jgi:hypothetical protein
MDAAARALSLSKLLKPTLAGSKLALRRSMPSD